MKKKIWYRGLGLADDKYIAEAHPDNVIKPRKNKMLISFVAACACLALVICNLWLFIPFNTDLPDVSQYADSEYYDLIQKLNLLTFEKPIYKNNAARLWAGLNRITFFSSTELPTTQFSPTRAEPRIKAQWRISVLAPMMQGAPRNAVGATVAVLCTQTVGETSVYSSPREDPRDRIRSLMPARACQG